MIQPRVWTLKQLAHDAETAIEIFRHARLRESLTRYTKFFETFVPVFRSLIDQLPRLSTDETTTFANLVRDDDTITAFRYLAAPPISEDDLKTLAKSTLSPGALCRDPEQARRVREIVLHLLDPHRFPWVADKRGPTDHERDRAIIASAALVAVSKVATERRKTGSRQQSDAVKACLSAADFREHPPRSILSFDSAPPPGVFCGESLLGSSRADIVVRLHDGRAMAIECKVSNSAVNSFKRINHEVGNKAASWLREFGKRHVVPAAVISGVFRPENLETAQETGLALFWQHRLEDLADFIQTTRP